MQTEMNYKLWMDSLNFHQTQGKTLAQALTLTEQWPFPYVNGQQTDKSRALMLDKLSHKPIRFDLSTVDEALL